MVQHLFKLIVMKFTIDTRSTVAVIRKSAPWTRESIFRMLESVGVSSSQYPYPFKTIWAAKPSPEFEFKTAFFDRTFAVAFVVG
mmetsp:Transcript_1957/g.1997  ORF Transcript_1957/g.1997 Transcript_1957/m.1997 type:complete len:84 (+) Transcript_1957:173-424(+)